MGWQEYWDRQHERAAARNESGAFKATVYNDDPVPTDPDVVAVYRLLNPPEAGPSTERGVGG